MEQAADIKGLEKYRRNCARCGVLFVGKETAVYCSGACRTAALRERRRAAQAEKDRE